MITHDRWQQIKEIFQSAQEKAPAERQDFLDAVCGDDQSIREEVEALLTADASNDNDHFLDTPAFEIGADLIADDDTSETIEFSAGHKVGRYTILCPLGAGGMGQIYLAQDDQLGRKIALKFISREFATNPRRVLRFEQEARVVSSLNHPNVCVVHETGVEDNRHFIAMEYIQGITLRDKLARETITPLEALQIAIQVAAALASAHAAGIVHRDVKPENIMLRPDGYVKVLDFGLAKLTERVPQPVSRNIHTEAGTLMGTVKYMSPEQLREFELDDRTDVWSLGVVLYEMLTGATPFESRIQNDSIVMILGPQSPALSWPDSLPARFREIITKALEKDREARYETVNKLAADLNSLRKDLEREIANGTFPAQPQIDWYRPPIAGKKTEQLTAGSAIFRRLKSQAFSTAEFLFTEITTNRTAAAIFTSITGALLFLLLIPNATQFVHRVVSSTAEQPAFKPKFTPFTNSGTSLSATYSPDGNLVAHVEEEHGKQRLVVSSTGVARSTAAVVPLEEARYLGVTFSRDNSYLYLTRKEKDGGRILYRLPYPAREGSQPLNGIKSDVDSPISLSPQGDQFAFVRFDKALSQYSVVVSDIDGGNERVLITRNGSNTLSTHGLSWSPDGSTIVCGTGFWTESFHMNLIAIDVKTGVERALGRKDWFYIQQVVWQPDNSGLIICAREGETTPFQLWRVRYPDGRFEKVTNDLNEYWGVSIAGDKLVTVKTERSWRTWVANPGARNESVQIAQGVGFTYGMSWSPQGYIVHSSKAGDRLDIARIDPDGGNSIRLTNLHINYSPVVSADGRYIVFSTDIDGRFNIWRMNAADGSELKQLTFTDANYYPSISPDGKWVAYDNMTNPKLSIWKVPLEGGEPVKIIDGYRMPVFSPDSNLIAARYDEESGSRDVAIFSADGGEALEHMPVPMLEWQTVRWLDRRTLSYVQAANGASNLYSYNLDSKTSKQLTFFDTDQIAAYAWSSDFKQVACQRVRNTGDVILISSER